MSHIEGKCEANMTAYKTEKEMLSFKELHGWQQKEKCDLYGYAGTSAMAEVWLTLTAEAQFILGGREEAQ